MILSPHAHVQGPTVQDTEWLRSTRLDSGAIRGLVGQKHAYGRGAARKLISVVKSIERREGGERKTVGVDLHLGSIVFVGVVDVVVATAVIIMAVVAAAAAVVIIVVVDVVGRCCLLILFF